jgi:hypothetical protein
MAWFAAGFSVAAALTLGCAFWTLRGGHWAASAVLGWPCRRQSCRRPCSLRPRPPPVAAVGTVVSHRARGRTTATPRTDSARRSCSSRSGFRLSRCQRLAARPDAGWFDAATGRPLGATTACWQGALAAAG